MRHDRRPWVRVAAWSPAGLTMLELAATLVLTALNADRASTGRTADDVIEHGSPR